MGQTGHEAGTIMLRYDKKRTPNYYVKIGDKIVYESDSAQELVHWTVDRYTYNFTIDFLYSEQG